MRRQRQAMLDELAKHTEQIREANAKKKEVLDKAIHLLSEKPQPLLTPCEQDIPDQNQ